MNRRKLITGIMGLIAAPAIVRASSLMQIFSTAGAGNPEYFFFENLGAPNIGDVVTIRAEPFELRAMYHVETFMDWATGEMWVKEWAAP